MFKPEESKSQSPDVDMEAPSEDLKRFIIPKEDLIKRIILLIEKIWPQFLCEQQGVAYELFKNSSWEMKANLLVLLQKEFDVAFNSGNIQDMVLLSNGMKEVI